TCLRKYPPSLQRIMNMKLPLLGLVIASLLILGSGCGAPPPADTTPDTTTEAESPAAQSPETQSPETQSPETPTPETPMGEAPEQEAAAELGPVEVDESVLTEVESLREFEKNP